MASLSELDQKLIKLQFSTEIRIKLYRQLMMYLKGGAQLSDALDKMYRFSLRDRDTPKTPKSYALRDWAARVHDGKSFSRAAAEWIPTKERTLLQAGEKAGPLAEALENVIYILRSSRKISSTVKKGLVYPAVLTVVAVILMLVYSLKVVPEFEATMPRDQWTGAAAALAAMADFTQYYLPYVGAALLALAVLVIYSLPRWTHDLRTTLDAFPPYSVFRLTNGVSFMLSLATMMKAGVNQADILDIMQVGASPYFKDRVSRCQRYVDNGINIGEALYKTKLKFPDSETIDDMRALATVEGFEDALNEMARDWLEISIEKIEAQMGMMRNVAMCLLGVVFGISLLGIFSLQEQMQAYARMM